MSMTMAMDKAKELVAKLGRKKAIKVAERNAVRAKSEEQEMFWEHVADLIDEGRV